MTGVLARPVDHSHIKKRRPSVSAATRKLTARMLRPEARSPILATKIAVGCGRLAT